MKFIFDVIIKNIYSFHYRIDNLLIKVKTRARIEQSFAFFLYDLKDLIGYKDIIFQAQNMIGS